MSDAYHDRRGMGRMFIPSDSGVAAYWWDARLRRWRSVEPLDGGITDSEIISIGRAYDEPLGGLF